MAYKNKEDAKKACRAWYLAHREEAIAKACEYQKEHKEEHAASCKKWSIKNREKVNGYGRKFRSSHRAECRQYWHDQYLDTEHWRWEDVEGYDGWTNNVHVHHRREGIGYSVAQLKEQGQYYKCRADELICVTNAEHRRIHDEIDKFFKRGKYKEK